MKSLNRICLEKLEKAMNVNPKKKFALVICDNPCDFDTSMIEADHISHDLHRKVLFYLYDQNLANFMNF